MKHKNYLVTNAVLEGASLKDAIAMTEAVLDAVAAEDFVKSPFYKGLEKNAAKMLHTVEAVDEYRKKREENPREFVEDELDNLEYTANMLTGLRLVNYPSEVQTQLAKLIRSALQGVKRGHQKLDSTPDEKVLDAFKPVEYLQRALATISDAFKLLNIPWDYDYRWENYLFDKDPAKSKIQTTKTQDGSRKIDSGVPESARVSQMVGCLMEAELGELSFAKAVEKIRVKKSEAEFFTNIWDNFGLERKVK